MMRCALSVILLLVVGSAQAATVTIDFEEFTPVSGMTPITVNSKGYTFFASTSFGNPPDIGISANGIYALAENNFGFCETCGAYITMERTDGVAFSIQSLESESFGSGTFSGTIVGGGTADLSVAVGTGDWLSLEALTYSEYTNFNDNYVRLDDIVVSAVPIPAAAYLFASGLGLLGWFRRKATAQRALNKWGQNKNS